MAYVISLSIPLEKHQRSSVVLERHYDNIPLETVTAIKKVATSRNIQY